MIVLLDFNEETTLSGSSILNSDSVGTFELQEKKLNAQIAERLIILFFISLP